jgi:transposase
MRRIQLASHLTIDELEARYRRAHEPTERSWWQILWLLARGQTAKLVAESTGYSRYWIGQLAKRYNAEGPAGMVNRQHTRARRTPLLLSDTQLDELRQALSGPAPNGERWTSRQVAAWMSERLGRPVAEQRGWDYLQRLGARLRQPRPRHVAASAEEQAAFKKRSVG